MSDIAIYDPENEWNELDTAAKSNLSEIDYRRFLDYKKQLKQDGHKWMDDAEDILSGYIWDNLENDS